MNAKVWFLLAAALLLAAVTPPAAQAVLADPAAGDETRAYWVFLRDRGTHALDDGTLAELARALPAETWARRWRGGAARLPGPRDLPLWEPYVAQVERHGALRHRSRWLNAVSADLDAAGLAAVARLACVERVQPVATATRASIGPLFDEDGQPLGRPVDVVRRAARRGAEVPGRLDYGAALGQLTEIGVPPVHALGYSANRVRFMMIDTGYYKEHDALTGLRVFHERDYVFGDGQTQNEPEDDHGQHDHGTATWSAAGGFAPGVLIGPAFGASFALAKTEDIRSETRIEEDWYVAALEAADSLGVSLTSASLCYLCFDSGFCYEFEDKDGDTAVITIALDIAAARGILCVNAQGNYGCDIGSLGTPADADSILAIGAVDSLNQITTFSACGPTYDGRIKPEVVARGRHTFAAFTEDPSSYGHTSGTSLSAPLVAGAAALLLEAHPEWGPMDVRQALLETADRAHAPDNTYGWGRIDIEAALTYTPLVHPGPFSLISPEDGAPATGLRPTFTWEPASDPTGGYPTYTLHLRDAGDPSQAWEVPAGLATTLVLPFALSPETAYDWDVTAETAAGRERVSRETRTFTTIAGSGVGEGAPAIAGAGLRLRLGANPLRGHLRFQAVLTGAEAGTAIPELQWSLHDPLGRRVAGGAQAAGTGADAAGIGYSIDTGLPRAGERTLPAGVYYLHARAGHRAARETVVVLAP